MFIDYQLPRERIAQRPIYAGPIYADPIDAGPLSGDDRSQAKLLQVCCGSALRVHHRVFSELPSLLRAGDLLVLNDSKVMPAPVFCMLR